MNPKYFTIALSISLTFLSCKEELQPQENSSAVRAEQNAAATPQTPAPAQNTPQPATTQATTASNTQEQGPLNPAHGQPGHRCDIAVGAPLTSKPAAKQTPAITTQMVTPQNIQSTPQIKTTPVTTAKGMNPPHGQPGHRCDIAVGAPLNSKPNPTTQAKTTTNTPGYTVTPNTTSGTPNLLTPSTTTPAPATTTASGTNPPHGQPGHVCGPAGGTPTNNEKKEEKKE